MNRLTTKQRLFVAHYLECWNATEAARRAGYSPKSASIIAHENLRKPNIQMAIRDGIAAIMPAGEVLKTIADHARGTLADFMIIADEEVIIERQTHLDDGKLTITTEKVVRPVARVDLKKAAAAGKLHLIKSYNLTERGLRIELHDAQAALALLGKHHGLFKDQGTILNVRPEDLANLSDEELDELARKRGLL